MSEINEELNGTKSEEQPQADAQQSDNQSEQKIPYERFKQKVAEANALKEKLAEFERQQSEAETKRLEEENRFKELYEQSQARIAEIEAQAKAAELLAKKQSLLLEAGYPADKLADVLGFIAGDDEETVKASVERFKSVAPPTPAYVDPAAGGGGRQQPEQKDGTEISKTVYDRIKNKIR
jgi:beta-glucosidase-like glycosyl hydrolase